jgi:hypothetical protein
LDPILIVNTIAKSIAAGSRIEPVLELNLEALEHLLFDVSDVSELPPTSHITTARRALNLNDKLFHQPQLIRVFFSKMLFANVRSLFLMADSDQSRGAVLGWVSSAFLCTEAQ